MVVTGFFVLCNIYKSAGDNDNQDISSDLHMQIYQYIGPDL